MTRYLFVVSYNDPARFDLVQHRLEGMEHVEVVYDRRYRERRRDEVSPLTERRRMDRRQHNVDATLDNLGWVMLRRD